MPVLCSGPALARLERLLAASGMRAFALRSAAQAIDLDATAFPCLVELGLPGDAGKRTALDEMEAIVLRRPSLPIIALVNGSGWRTGADLLGIHPSWNVHVLEWPAAETRLARLIVLCRFWIWSELLSAGVSTATHLPYLVRGGLRFVLSMRIPYPRISEDGPEWRIRVIAEGVGCSTRTLTRQALRADVDFHGIADAWVVLLLLVLHEVEGISWQQLALAVGYEGIPGVSELTLRAFDRRPRSLSGGGIEPGLQRFEGLMRQALEKR